MRPRLPHKITWKFRIACLGWYLIALHGLSQPATAVDPPTEPSVAESPSFFETEVRPIFKTHCFHCHGESDHKESGLDLRLVRFMKAGGDSGPALQPGDADQSLLWQRVHADEMPPAGKSLSASEKALLKRWIAMGAQTKRDEPEQPSVEDWTEEERNFWAFQKVQTPRIPIVSVTASEKETARSPIDAFILEPLQAKGLTLSESADRAALIRRLTFDLLGLPPSPEEIVAFEQDGSVDAYERLVDRLLADPRYGEHWGRHWLDVAGYADSDGYTEQDTERVWAFQYRDYVIRAFNRDLPIDQFVIDQLAGDELVPQPWDHLQPDQIERLAATGFLRTAPDGTGHEGVDPNTARNDVIAETIKIVSTSLLGMTVGCAQCHDHRYDPISQRDYYRLRALFEPALDWKQWRDKPSRLVNLWTPEEKQRALDVDQELATLEAKRVSELDTIVNEIFDKEVMKLPEEKREMARVARATAADQRSPEQQQLLRDFPSLNVDRGSAVLYDGARINEFNKRFETQQSELKAKRPPDHFLPCLAEVPGHVPTTYVFSRGDIQQPKDPIAPGGLSILGEQERIPADNPDLPTTGRRLAFAQLLTDGAHPLLSRALVNQIWMRHFGRGIASMPGDLGTLGDRPTHPELLDWLASELVASQWSRKRLQRSILTATTYRQSSSRLGASHESDPENRWLSRMSVRRLQSETLRDAMLSIGGQLVLAMHGPPMPVNPDDVGQFILGRATRDGNGILVAKPDASRDAFRRSIYTQVRRSMPLGILEPFDPAALAPNCDRRNNSTVATQSLMMMNNSTVLELSEHFARRVQRDAGDDPAAQVAYAWMLAVGRPISPQSQSTATDWLIQLRAALTKPAPDGPADNTIADATSPEPPMGILEPEPAKHQALALFCQAIFSSNAFLYVD
jgi:hypothetical protein